MEGWSTRSGHVRSRWAAVGAAIAVSLGAGSVLTTSASLGSGERSVFVPITPCRAVDTRSTEQVGPRGTPLGANDTYTTAIVGTVGKCTIPADASAVVLNLAIVHPTADSYLTVFPAGGAVPLAANLNFIAGQAPVSNAATVDIGAGGLISFYNLRGTVDVTADVSGYYVDHTHDDRYVQKQQTIVADGFASVLRGTGGAGTLDGCFAVAVTPGENSGRLTFPVPVGTIVRGARVTMYDGGTATAYSVAMTITTTSTLGNTSQTLASAVGGSLTNTVTVHAITPTTPFAIGSTHSIGVDYSLGTGTFTNGLCQVQLDVTLP